MNEQIYTVFSQEKFGIVGFSLSGKFGFPSELQECIDHYAEQHLNEGATLIAWAPGHVDWINDRGAKDRLCAESIAAGRLIEKVGDSYVPRGVAVEKEETPSAYEQELRNAIDHLLALKERRNTAEPKRERLTWADTKPFNPFDGFLVAKGSISQPTPASKFTSPDLKETSHQVSPGFGSAYIGKA